MRGSCTIVVVLLFVLLISIESLRVAFSSLQTHIRPSLALEAKKSKKSGKGFGTNTKKAKPTEEMVGSDVSAIGTVGSDDPNTGLKNTETKEVLTDAEAVFRKYGINTDSKEARAKAAKQVQEKVGSSEPVFGEKVMANISMQDQAKADQLLVTGTFLTLSYVVISGIGMSVTALKVVFPTIEIPPLIESVVKDVLTPSFTPALGVFFFFSITFGLFKFAQVSSSQTLYTEE